MQYQILTLTQAVEHINKGHCVIFPTETFFAIGCNFSNISGISNIFQAKNRTPNQPLPLLLGSINQLPLVASEYTNALPLIKHFWPGPLSIIFQASKNVPTSITAQTGTVALRLTSHPIAQRLSQLVGEPLVGTSANISKEPPAASISELNPKLFPFSSGIVTPIPKPKGNLPSTIIRYTQGTVSIVREGAISKAAIQAVLHKNTL